MRYASLWSPVWSTGAGPAPELVSFLLEFVPRVVVEGRGLVWADLRGLPAIEVLGEFSSSVGNSPAGFPSSTTAGVRSFPLQIGLARIPIVAELAARRGESNSGVELCAVEPGTEREFLSSVPIPLLASAAGRSGVRSRRLLALFEGVGLSTAGELAALDPASIEVRFGAEGIYLWRLARGDDRRKIFAPIPPERPHASLDFIDYQVTDPAHLIFTINSLLEGLATTLRRRGEVARRILLTLSLAGGGEWCRTLRAAHPTARREVWIRLVRNLLERVELPHPVVGVGLEVEVAEPSSARQGDLFDRGFATSGLVEMALIRLLEEEDELIIEPRVTGHPLPEERIDWRPVEDPFAEHISPRSEPSGRSGPPDGLRLVLNLLPEPVPVDVEVGGDRAPIRYRDREGWHQVLSAAGPDRISGGQWVEPYAREYFRCVTEGGDLIWVFYDARRETWFLHGWWG